MRKRNRWHTWIALLALAGQSPLSALAQEVDASEEEASAGLVGGAEVALHSGYYYRGEDVFAGTLNLQPTLTLGWALARAELDLELWGAFPLHDRGALKDVRDEVDLLASTTIAASDRLELYAALQLAFVPAEGVDPYIEVLLGAAWEFGAGFAVWGEAAVALETETGVYFAAGPSWSGALGSAFELELSAGVGGTRYRGDVLRAVEIRLETRLGADLGAGFEAAFSAVYAHNPSARADVGDVGFGLGYGW
jgi:hypothetical protein